jgi:hypothetical protein
MAVSAADINSRFEEETPVAQGAEAGAAAGQPSAEEQKLLDDAAKVTADAGKAGGAQLPDDVAKELEELRRYKQENSSKPPEDTPEQKAEKDKQYQADLHKFAFDKGLYAPEDLGKLENLKNKQDNDLVYDNFKDNFKTINKDATDEEIKEAYEAHYHINSENEHLKKLGESRIQQEASNYRTPVQSKFDSAKTQFDTQRNIDAKVPEFDGFLDKVIKAHSPENWAVFKTKDGDEEIPVNFQLTEADRKAAYDAIRNSDNFGIFLREKDPKNVEEFIQKQVEAHYRLTHNDKINKAIFDGGVSLGTKKGSTTGADNSFAVNQNKGATQQADISAMEELSKSDDRMRDHRQNYG